MTRAPSRPEPKIAAEPPDANALLSRAVDEAARLLHADGAMVYLVDPETNRLRFAVDAGIRNPEAQQLVRDLSLPVGVGLFGHAVASGEVVVSSDYRRDRRFSHSPVADRIAKTANMRSMVAAPLVAEGEVLGALGAYSSRIDGFDPAGVALLRALADHAAAAISNQRLIERLALSQEQLARRVEAQRTLGQITASIATIRQPDEVLQDVVDAARRLIGSDGAHLALMQPGGQFLRPSVVAGATAPEMRAWLHTLQFPVGGGINGMAAEAGETIATEDYVVDARIPHEAHDQEVADRMGLRGMAAAPLRAPGGEVIGTLAVSFEQPHRFGEDELELLRGLADQGAIAIANARLVDDLSSSEGRFRHLVTSSPDLVWETDAEGQFTFLSPRLAELTDWAPDQLLGKGWPAIVAPESMADAQETWVGLHSDPSVVRKIRFLLRRREGEPIPAEVYAIGSERNGIFTGAHGSIRDLTESERLTARLRDQADELAHRVEAQRTMAEMAAQLTSLRDPSAVLRQTLRAAVRLLEGDGGQIGMVSPDDEGVLRWGDGHSLVHDRLDPFSEEDHTRADDGVSGRAIILRRTTWTDDYLADTSFNHDAASDRAVGELGIRAVIAAPLLAEDGPMGAIGVYSEEPGVFDADDGELLGLLADQAAIVLRNARLYEELRERADAQRSLAEIAAQIAALHNPLTVIQRAVADAARLLRADRAQVNLAAEDATFLERPIAAAPLPPSPDDVVVPIGSGIAGMAAAERRVRWTGDYLGDDTFPHDDGDGRIAAQGIHSMMAAPLLGPDRLIGTITVQASAMNAFNDQDAELLKLLADQAAIALTNARLYAEIEESERRYRHLVDNSPDIVWSVDADGRFTFFSDSLEGRTGWTPEQLLGQPFSMIAGEKAQVSAMAAWEMLRENPDREQRLRLDLPLPDGRVAQTEVAMTGTIVDGRFAGAHGAVRDISERERLEGDLRSQAAELAASQERAHLARELHDSVTQALFSMGLTLRTMELLLDTDPGAAREKVTELRELQKDALAEMRTLIFELRPSSLEADGLVQALRTHATAVQRRTGLTIVVDAEPIDRLTLPAEEALYRIGQEAIHNVVKHANASLVTLRIARDDEWIILSVTDDGMGFAPDAVPRGHLGLIGMRQRVDLVGGELRVESQPGMGTSIAASVPVSAE